MRNNLFLFVILANFLACSSKPEPNLELSSQEAFYFDIGNVWEVNASVNAKGFKQFEKDNKWQVELTYSIDLVTPKGDSLFSIFENSVVEKKNEEITGLQLEAQIEIDTSFSEGEYKIIFNVQDELAKQSKSTYIDFKLTKD